MINSNGLMNVYHQDAQRYMQIFYETKKSLFLHGTFGIGKSEAVRVFCQQQADRMKLEFSDKTSDINDPKKFCFLPIILHQFDPAELKGIPYPNEERTLAIYLHMGLLPVNPDSHGVIFFDELNLAAPMLQNNAYQIINDKQIGSYVVPKGYATFAAGNLTDDRGNTLEMAMPLNNRFFHLQLNPPKVDDMEMSQRNGTKKNIEGWVTAYAYKNDVDLRVINYLMYQKDYLFTFKPEDDTEIITCGTPRMWKHVSDCIKGITDLDVIEGIVAQGVGPAIAMEFVAWLLLSQHYDIIEIFKTGQVDPPQGIDELYSLLAALASHYVDKKDAIESEQMAQTLLKISFKFKKEHGIMLLRGAKESDKNFVNKLSKNKESFKTLPDAYFDLLV